MGAKQKRKKAAVEAPAEPQPVPAPARAPFVAIPQLMSRWDWKLVAVVLGISFVAYLNSLGNDFVYDDQFQILKNPTIADFGNIPRMFTESVWQFMNSSADSAVGSYYRPIFNILLIVNYRLFGFDAAAWHFVSVFFHLAVTLGVFVLARQWSVRSETAAAAALLFGLHPTHVESVAWASGIPDPLAAVFLVGALLLYERFHQERGARVWLLGASLGLAMLAMLSKETAIVFPAFVGLRELLDRGEGESLVDRFVRALRRSIPYGAVAVGYFGIRYAVLGFISRTEPKAVGIPTEQVYLTIPSVLAHYAKLLFVPYPLAITYDVRYVASASDPRFWGPLVLVVLLLAAAVWLVHASAVGRRALCWTVLFLLPVMNLKAFNQEESLVHDRYLYIPTIGFCILAAMGLEWLAARFADRRQQVFTAVTASACTLLLGLTVLQNATWANDMTMATNALAHDVNRPFLYNYVGAWYFNNSDAAQAETWYRKAVELNPDYVDSLTNLGDVYKTQNKLQEAEQSYLKAIAAGSPYYNTYFNLAGVYMTTGRLAEAQAQLQRALEIQPSAEATYSLGWVYDQQNNQQLAEQWYARALQIRPGYPEPRINLAVLQTKQGRYKDALDNLLYVQKIVPQHPIMLYALGDVYLKSGRYQDAITALTQLTQIEPQHRLAYTSLGLCYEKTGNAAKARESFQRAIQVAPQDPYTNVAREHLGVVSSQ